MSQGNFQDQNRDRAYPFCFGTIGLPTFSRPTTAVPPSLQRFSNEFIVDAGFQIQVPLTAVPQVRLVKAELVAGSYHFTFQAADSVLASHPLVFTVPAAAEDFSTVFSEVTDSSHCQETLWEGFLTIGQLSLLHSRNAYGYPDAWEVLGSESEAIIEPARIKLLAQTQLRSLNVGHTRRLYATSPAGCPDWDEPEPAEDIPGPGLVATARCLTGDILVAEGYNVTAARTQNPQEIRFTAEPGSGLGFPCQSLPTFPGEAPPDGSLFLEGGLACNEVLRSLNGIGGPKTQLLAGAGLSISAFPEIHTIIIDVNLHDLDICPAKDSP